MKTQTKILWLLIVIITFLTLSAKAQHVGIENAMLDIPDGYYLSKSDTVKALLITSSNEWSNEYGEIPVKTSGYKVTRHYRNTGGLIGRNKSYETIYIYLDENKEALKNTVIWGVYEVTESDLERAKKAKPKSIRSSEILDYGYTELYDSSKCVRVNEFQELKQKLNDKQAEYKRQIALHILARFCTFMSPEKAAIEAARYSDALLKELEKYHLPDVRKMIKLKNLKTKSNERD